MMNEIWKSLEMVECGSDYELSNTGKVKSLKHGKKRILKTYISDSGWEYVVLCEDGHTEKYYIESLMKMLFSEDEILETEEMLERKLQCKLAQLNTIKYQIKHLIELEEQTKCEIIELLSR